MDKCSECNSEVSAKVSDYSKGKWGRPVCYDCQQKMLKEKTSHIDWTKVPRSSNKVTATTSKDTLIIRQSCLKAAVEIVGQLDQPGEPVTLAIGIAERFEKWVKR